MRYHFVEEIKPELLIKKILILIQKLNLLLQFMSLFFLGFFWCIVFCMVHTINMLHDLFFITFRNFCFPNSHVKCIEHNSFQLFFLINLSQTLKKDILSVLLSCIKGSRYSLRFLFYFDLFILDFIIFLVCVWFWIGAILIWIVLLHWLLTFVNLLLLLHLGVLYR